MKLNFDIDRKKLTKLCVENVDRRDYPDFVDCYVESAYYDGRKLTDSELDWLNETHPEVAQEAALENWHDILEQ